MYLHVAIYSDKNVILTSINYLSGSNSSIAQMACSSTFFLTSSSCHPKALVKEFSYFLMPCHQHGLGVNLLVQR